LQSIRGGTINQELIQAAKDLTLLQCLLKRIDIEATTNYKYTLLILASANGNLEVVNYLLDQGANIRAKTDQGVNSFSMAAEKGHLQIVKALYRKDSSILEQKVRW
jgi:ankyrin repeat protein